MSGIGKQLLELVYPPHPLCLACDCFSRCGPLCGDCAEELQLLRLKDGFCAACGAPLRDGTACACDLPAGITVRSAYIYRGVVAELIQRMKFGQTRPAAIPLLDGMEEAAKALTLPDETTVTWITMPDSRWRERSMDHAQVLAEELAARLQLPCRRLVTRMEGPKALRHQLGLSGAERRQNLQGTFRCAEMLSGMVLLIDDVYTTGATTLTCAETLLQAGAEKVFVLTAARAVMEK